MNKSTPAIDYGSSGIVESCPRLAIKDIMPMSYRAWQQQVLQQGAVEVNSVTIGLVTSKLPGGGRRFWFICPNCERRCAVLHSQPINGTVGCRVCLGLKYQKSRFKGMIECDILNENEYDRRRKNKESGKIT